MSYMTSPVASCAPYHHPEDDCGQLLRLLFVQAQCPYLGRTFDQGWQRTKDHILVQIAACTIERLIRYEGLRVSKA